MSPVALAELCRRAENEYAGSPCGVMDPLICLAGRPGCALRIDCATLEFEAVPLPVDRCEVVVVDTGVRHSIASGAYADRRRACAEALARLRAVDASIGSLRDVTLARLDALACVLDDRLAARVRHVVTENTRVLAATDDLRAGRLEAFGRRMALSHASLRDDYEVSCAELDVVVEGVCGVDGVYGARMTGGGFGGCVVAVVQPGASGVVESVVARICRDRGWSAMRVMAVRPVGGCEVVGM